jgi:NAD-dependent DNA ligase
MQSFVYLLAVEPEMVKELLPLGDAVVGAVAAIIGSIFTYILGRRKSSQEVENLQAEKKSIEAASGLSTAEAAQVISEAAAAMVQPLIDRVHQQQEEIKYLTDRVVWKRGQLDELRTLNAKLRAENELYRQKFKLQGETPPELPPEVK